MSFCPKCGTDVVDSAKFCPACGNTMPQAAPAPATPEDPYIGRNIDDKFRVEQLLGIGGMGRVYRATQLSLDKDVCVKVLRTGMQDETLARRFQREARAASRLNHPNSITVIDFGQAKEDGALYLAMEYIPGKDLGKIIAQEYPLGERRIVHIMDQVLSALADAHAAGIVHRDLKPENIMVTDLRGTKDFVKVLDFGIAKIQESTAEPGLTQVGMVCGTPEYMSPEQARGEELDARSDLYAAGVILYQMVTGNLPFIAPTAMGIVTKHLVEPPKPPSQLENVQVSAALESVILKSMSKDKNGRQVTALSLQQELNAVLAPQVAPAQQQPEGQELFAVNESGVADQTNQAEEVAATVLRPSLSDSSPHPIMTAPPSQPAKGKQGLFWGLGIGILVLVVAVVAYLLFSSDQKPTSQETDKTQNTQASMASPATQPVETNKADENPKQAPSPDKTAKNQREPVKVAATRADKKQTQAISESARLQYAAGKEQMAKQKFSKAIKYFLRAIKSSPTYADAHKALATCFLNTGALQKAKRHFNRYLKLRPNAPDSEMIQSMIKDL